MVRIKKVIAVLMIAILSCGIMACKKEVEEEKDSLSSMIGTLDSFNNYSYSFSYDMMRSFLNNVEVYGDVAENDMTVGIKVGTKYGEMEFDELLIIKDEVAYLDVYGVIRLKSVFDSTRPMQFDKDNYYVEIELTQDVIDLLKSKKEIRSLIAEIVDNALDDYEGRYKGKTISYEMVDENAKAVLLAALSGITNSEEKLINLIYDYYPLVYKSCEWLTEGYVNAYIKAAPAYIKSKGCKMPEREIDNLTSFYSNFRFLRKSSVDRKLIETKVDYYIDSCQGLFDRLIDAYGNYSDDVHVIMNLSCSLSGRKGNRVFNFVEVTSMNMADMKKEDSSKLVISVAESKQIDINTPDNVYSSYNEALLEAMNMGLYKSLDKKIEEYILKMK